MLVKLVVQRDDPSVEHTASRDPRRQPDHRPRGPKNPTTRPAQSDRGNGEDQCHNYKGGHHKQPQKRPPDQGDFDRQSEPSHADYPSLLWLQALSSANVGKVKGI